MEEEEYEKRGNKNGLVAFLIIVIVLLLLVIDAVLVYFYAVNKIKKEQQDNTTTTTTTTTVVQDIKMPKDLSEYELLIKDYIKESTEGGLILLDDTFKNIKFDYSCDKIGTTTNKVDGHDVSYNCTKYDEDQDVYEVIITVDNKYSFKEYTSRTCGADNYYIGENFIIDYDPSCAPGNENIQIYNQNKTEAYSAGGNKAPYINIMNSLTEVPNDKHYRPFIKNSSLYFIGVQSKMNSKTTCNIYKIDLSKKNQSIDKSAGFECDFLSAD